MAVDRAKLILRLPNVPYLRAIALLVKPCKRSAGVELMGHEILVLDERILVRSLIGTMP